MRQQSNATIAAMTAFTYHLELEPESVSPTSKTFLLRLRFIMERYCHCGNDQINDVNIG